MLDLKTLWLNILTGGRWPQRWLRQLSTRSRNFVARRWINGLLWTMGAAAMFWIGWMLMPIIAAWSIQAQCFAGAAILAVVANLIAVVRIKHLYSGQWYWKPHKTMALISVAFLVILAAYLWLIPWILGLDAAGMAILVGSFIIGALACGYLSWWAYHLWAEDVLPASGENKPASGEYFCKPSTWWLLRKHPMAATASLVALVATITAITLAVKTGSALFLIAIPVAIIAAGCLWIYWIRIRARWYRYGTNNDLAWLALPMLPDAEHMSPWPWRFFPYETSASKANMKGNAEMFRDEFGNWGVDPKRVLGVENVAWRGMTRDDAEAMCRAVNTHIAKQ